MNQPEENELFSQPEISAEQIIKQSKTKGKKRGHNKVPVVATNPNLLKQIKTGDMKIDIREAEPIPSTHSSKHEAKDVQDSYDYIQKQMSQK